MLKKSFNQIIFLYENNKSASQSIKDQISKELNVGLQYIDSALVSAQHRQRFYAHNIPNVQVPKDRNIYLRDIINIKDVECAGSRGRMSKNLGKRAQKLEIRAGNKTNALTTVQKDNLLIYPSLDKEKSSIYVMNKETNYKGNIFSINLPDGYYTIRNMTPIECERLQTLPDNYTEGISNTQRFKCLGNGWTAEVIIHILSYIDYPKNQPIEVLSMYDGIATGMYCLDKLGYTNIIYKAYEIDKYAIQIAKKNYPNIIECGDAFQVRNEDWRY